MTVPDPLAITVRVIAALDTLQVPYLLGGSFASAIYGVPRSTLDADIVADLRVEQVDPLAGLLGKDFYYDVDTMRHAVRQRSSFNLIHLKTMFKVDIFVFKGRPYDYAQMARRTPQALTPESDQVIYAASADDTILTKLDWYRMGGEVSERQWRDVVGVISAQGDRLDRAYLQQWAIDLNVADLLQRAFAEAVA